MKKYLDDSYPIVKISQIHKILKLKYKTNVKLMDIHNYINGRFPKVKNESAHLLQQFKDQNEGFYFKVKTSSTDELEMIFFMSKYQIDLCQLYADVIVYDATYRTNR